MIRMKLVYSILVFGIGIAFGIAIAWLWLREPNGITAQLWRGEARLNAFAAQGSDSFAIASGPVDGHLDGVFCLDFRSGDLTGFVLSPRNGRFLAAFKTSILKDLPMEQGKIPKYAMVMGNTDATAFRLNVQVGGSIIYVADCNTGRVAAYAFPWSATPNASPDELLAEPLISVDVASPSKLRLRK
jgi:hypothetical protein